MIDMLSIIIASGLLLYLVWESLRAEGKFGYGKQEGLEKRPQSGKAPPRPKAPNSPPKSTRAQSRRKGPSYL